MAEYDKKTKKRTPTPIDSSYGHLQPQATDVERAVLGALMVDKDAFTEVSEMLSPETFYEPRHQKIYSAICELNFQEKPVDMMTVIDQLKHDGTFEEVGGMEYILDLSHDVASSAHVEYHARIIAQKFLARQLISFASNIETKAFDETVDVDELMQETEGALFELSRKNIKQDYTQIDPVIKEASQMITKAAGSTGGITGVASGFSRLDEITAGWQNSDLVIIAGRPAMGKTSFALSIAKNVAVDYKIPTAVFSLEMNNVQLVQRLISNVCEITGNKLLSGQLTTDDWDRFDKRLRLLLGSPLYVDDTPALSIFEFRSKARRLVREKGVKLIMIDYLQLMNASGARFGSRQEEISTISRSLKGIAKELDVPILALSQVSRKVEERDGPEGKRPLLSDLRESGAIEQDADMVLFVHRPEYYHINTDDKGNDMHGKAQIIIAKHRKGATGDVLLSFKGEYTRFSDPDEDYVPMSGGGTYTSKINGQDADPDEGDFPPPMPYGGQNDAFGAPPADVPPF